MKLQQSNKMTAFPSSAKSRISKSPNSTKFENQAIPKPKSRQIPTYHKDEKPVTIHLVENTLIVRLYLTFNRLKIQKRRPVLRI